MIFPPGTRVRLRGFSEGYVFLVTVGGYVVEDSWSFHSCLNEYFNDTTFERVE